MSTSPCVLQRNLRFLCVQSLRVLHPALKTNCVGELGVRVSCSQVLVAPLCPERPLKKKPASMSPFNLYNLIKPVYG